MGEVEPDILLDRAGLRGDAFGGGFVGGFVGGVVEGVVSDIVCRFGRKYRQGSHLKDWYKQKVEDL